MSLGVGFVLFWGLLAGRYFWIQIIKRAEYRHRADNQYFQTIIIQPKRGKILDRNGIELTLNEPAYAVGVSPRKVPAGRRNKLAREVARALKLPLRQVNSALESDRSFAWLARRLPESMGSTLTDMKTPHFHVFKVQRRRYPYGALTAQLLGFTDIDNRGISGIEELCENVLAGIQGRWVYQRDAVGRDVAPLTRKVVPARDGQDVFLTIDYLIQAIAADELRAALKAHKADGGSVVVVDPTNGEIYAMMSLPSFDPDRPTSYPAENWRIRPVTDTYSPGSTFKLVAFTAGINEGILRLDQEIDCEHGEYAVYNKVYQDVSPYDNLPVAEVLKKSSNIGTIKIAQNIGRDIFYQYCRSFGFGVKTGIEFQGEAPGQLNDPSKWSGLSLPAMSIGYEVTVTPLQLVMAYSALANGGLLLRPRILMGTRDNPSSRSMHSVRDVVRRVMKPETAAILRDLLEGAVRDGTGHKAAVRDVRVGGKTGTSRVQKPMKNGKKEYVSFFVGFFPVESPRFAMLVVVENPRRGYYGGEVAAPAFRRILRRLVTTDRYQDLVQSNEDESGAVDEPELLMPDLRLIAVPQAKEWLSKLDVQLRMKGEGSTVLEQKPAPGTVLASGQEVVILVGARPGDDAGRQRLPNVVGLPLREAISMLTLRDVEVRVVGNGRVVKQTPSSGTPVKPGQMCLLKCEPPRI